MCCFTKLSSNIQLWLICHPKCISSLVLTLFYTFDLITYSINPKKFLQNRSRILGKNFAALGRVIIGEYEQVVSIIESPQKRGYFLGRARLAPNKVAQNFPLFLSDEAAGGTPLHATLHTHFWETLVPPVLQRINDDEDGAFDNYISSGVKNAATGSKQKEEIAKMTVRYMFHAFFGAPLSDESLVNAVHSLLFAASPTQSYVTGATKPFATLVACFQGSRRRAFRKVQDWILESPLLSNYVPSAENGNQSKTDYAQMIFSVVGIAGILGTSNLLLNVLAIPQDASIDMNNKKQVMNAVLESARVKAPVNTVNAILVEERSMVVNGKERRIPAGSVVGGSIGLASLDPAVFPSPDTYNHERENLVKAVINFNAVGFNVVGAGTRQCPGRNVAMKIASDVLLASRT